MRINTPLTGIERKFGENQRLISATDTSSKIVYCNDEFVAISGFARDELIESPHNIVRHPDMPAAVYENMWQHLKAGKCWMGIVKNRCKNGDHYWVEAYVTPIIDSGKIIGYESVRTSPCRERVKRAEAIYQEINDCKSNSQLKIRIAEMLRLLSIPLLIGAMGGGLLLAVGSTITSAAIPVLSACMACMIVFKNISRKVDAALNELPGSFNDELATRIFTNESGLIAKLRMTLISQNSRIRTILTRLRDYAEQTKQGSAEAKVLADMTAHALTRQRTDTDMAATAMTEMTASISEVASNIQATAQQAEGASQLVARGSEVAVTTLNVIEALSVTVEKVTLAVESLASETEDINTAASLIQSIADQTNLLALNAAIEAARAGEQGRGFAVVADEVRSLAQKTRNSTESIKDIISTLLNSAKNAVEIARKGNHDAERGVKHVSETQHALEGIKSAMDNINSMAQQMAAAAEEQSHVAEDISRQINQIADAADSSLDNASNANKKGQELERTAADLFRLTERFKE